MTVWLCTDAAWNVNGKIFHVAGGSIALAHEEDAGADDLEERHVDDRRAGDAGAVAPDAGDYQPGAAAIPDLEVAGRPSASRA